MASGDSGSTPDTARRIGLSTHAEPARMDRSTRSAFAKITGPRNAPATDVMEHYAAKIDLIGIGLAKAADFLNG